MKEFDLSPYAVNIPPSNGKFRNKRILILFRGDTKTNEIIDLFDRLRKNNDQLTGIIIETHGYVNMTYLFLYSGRRCSLNRTDCEIFKLGNNMEVYKIGGKKKWEWISECLTRDPHRGKRTDLPIQ